MVTERTHLLRSLRGFEEYEVAASGRPGARSGEQGGSQSRQESGLHIERR